MSLRFRVVFASACAVLALLLCHVYVQGVREETDRARSDAIARYGGEIVGLVVAGEGLEPGQVVGQADVAVRDWAAALAPEGAATRLEDVVGREVSVPVARNAPVTELAFRNASDSAQVPAGHVGLSLPITDKLGISRNVAVGSQVIAYRVGDTGSELLARDMQVISSPGTSPIAGSGQLGLAVLPEDVSAVLSSSAKGDLRLVLPAEDVRDGEGAETAKAPEELEDPADSPAVEGVRAGGEEKPSKPGQAGADKDGLDGKDGAAGQAKGAAPEGSGPGREKDRKG